MIKKAEYFAGKVVFEDSETKRVYRRVVGALGWPEPPEPGSLVVIAEGLVVESGLGTRPLWLLAEAQGATVLELYLQCRAWGRLCQVDAWLADLEREEEVNWFMHLANQQQANIKPEPVFMAPVAYSGPRVSLGLLLQLVDEQCLPNRKILSLNEVWNARRRTVMTEELSKPARNYPALAALGYAVAELVLNAGPEAWETAPKHQTMKDYQPGQGARG